MQAAMTAMGSDFESQAIARALQVENISEPA
jgi:hypothetical protein